MSQSGVSESGENQSGESAYAAAGVSIEAADRAIDLMKVWVDKARRPEMIGGLGGFAGLFDASALTRYRRPLLATSTDGVGTKVAIAQAMDVHDTIGFDLVGMVVDDLVVCGAEPLFMTDYIATGRVVPERIAAIVKGIAEACVQAGCALVGGETAEHPGLLGPDEYDVAGATTGRRRGRPAARPGPGPAGGPGAGDGVVGAALQRLLPGPPRPAQHRRLVPGPRGPRARPDAGRGAAGADLASTPRRASRWPTRPTRTRCRTSPEAGWRPTSSACMPAELTATIDRATWTPQPVFDVVRRVGDVSQADLEQTLNCGVGMVALLPADDVDAAVRLARRARRPGLGGRRGLARQDSVSQSPTDDTSVQGGRVHLVGQHPGW